MPSRTPQNQTTAENPYATPEEIAQQEAQERENAALHAQNVGRKARQNQLKKTQRAQGATPKRPTTPNNENRDPNSQTAHYTTAAEVRANKKTRYNTLANTRANATQNNPYDRLQHSTKADSDQQYENTKALEKRPVPSPPKATPRRTFVGEGTYVSGGVKGGKNLVSEDAKMPDIVKDAFGNKGGKLRAGEGRPPSPQHN